MSRSGGGGFIISWPLIIALVVGYNVLFSDDEDKDKKVTIPETEIVVTDTTEKPSLEIKLKQLGDKTKTLVQEGVEVTKDGVKEIIVRLKQEKETSKNDKTQDIEEEEKEVIEEKDIVVEKPNPLEKEETPVKETGMKKL